MRDGKKLFELSGQGDIRRSKEEEKAIKSLLRLIRKRIYTFYYVEKSLFIYIEVE
jgi:hypothetical protein